MGRALNLRTQLIAILVSEPVLRLRRRLAEAKRRLTGQPHVVSVFLGLDDPYSCLLAHYLPALAECYDIELRYCLAQALGDAFQPRAEMLAAYAEEDCRRVARELGVPFLDRGNTPPVEYRRALIESLAQDESPGKLLEAISLYWRGDAESVARRVEGMELTGKGDDLVAGNRKKLARMGHYSSAMLHYGGEWYWGVDRMRFLTQRLDELGLRQPLESTARLASIRQAMQVTLPVAPPTTARSLPPLEFFHSFRSPYSYLSLKRVFAIAGAFGLELRIRPVLPMIGRGLPVPKQKLRYIGEDACREARRLGLPFGKFADPAGKGVERCMAVFSYALSEKRERDFLLNAGEAIWGYGIDVASDKGMRKVTGRTGLFWPEVVEAMRSDDWRETVEENRESMEQTGTWGVPTLRLGDFVVWGQDRDWLLVRHLEELCDTGEGILI
jgi:2-hydroxychromene-2-carboxylate isomerase